MPVMRQLSTISSGSTAVEAAITESADLSAILSFDDPALRRATSIGWLTSFGGQIFSSSQGSELTFARSRPVESIHTFISHNWAVGRWRKYLLISLYFNLEWGSALALLIIIVLVAVRAGMGEGWEVIFKGVEPGWNGLLHGLVTPSMFLVILLGRNVASCFGWQGPPVFLDKCCISQTDKHMQRQGIEKLGAFLCDSKHLLVCFSELYLMKLWTVYEVCMFLVLKEHERISVVPVDLAVLAFSVSILFWFVALCYIIVRTYYSPQALVPYFAVACLFYLGSTFAMTRWSRHYFLRHSMLKKACETFDVRTAHCAHEEDRHYVEQGIVLLMRHVQKDRPGEVSSETLLTEFNGLVRTWAPWAVSRSTGRFGVPLKYLVVVLTVPTVTLSLELPDFFPQEPLPMVILRSLTTTCLVLAFAARSSTSCPRLEGFLEVAYLSLLSVAIVLIYLFLNMELELLLLQARCETEVCTGRIYWCRWTRLLLLLGVCALLFRPAADKSERLSLEFSARPEPDTFAL